MIKRFIHMFVFLLSLTIASNKIDLKQFVARYS